MSEPAPETSRPHAVPSRSAPGGGNFLTRKVGPLPTWAWLGIIGVGGAAVWYFYKSRQATSAAAAATDTGNTGGSCTDSSGNSVPCDQVDYGGQIATLQAELESLQQGESTEAGQGQVPNVVGQTQATAFGVLTAAGFKPSGSPVVKGKVLTVDSQTPEGGSTAAKGTTVTLKSSVHTSTTSTSGGGGGGGKQLTRTWTSEGGATLAQVMGRLGTKKLTPANAAAIKWYNGAYKRNHNAKMPKGLTFTYTEGTVTNK